MTKTESPKPRVENSVSLLLLAGSLALSTACSGIRPAQETPVAAGHAVTAKQQRIANQLCEKIVDSTNDFYFKDDRRRWTKSGAGHSREIEQGDSFYRLFAMEVWKPEEEKLSSARYFMLHLEHLTYEGGGAEHSQPTLSIVLKRSDGPKWEPLDGSIIHPNKSGVSPVNDSESASLEDVLVEFLSFQSGSLTSPGSMAAEKK